MSVEGFIEGDGEGIIYVHSGTMSGNELIDRTRHHFETLNTDKLRYQIMDLRAVERIEMTSDQVKEVAAEYCKSSKSYRPDHKLAIVLDSDPLFAILQLWKTYLEDPEVQGKIFNNMDEARAWITNYPE